MNFIFVSPNFPIRNFKWVESLKGHGINVLAIGDSPHWDLHPRLRNAAREYYFVPDLSDYGKVLEGCRYFERKYGKIDYIESNNEWWLTLDARLRKDMGVTTGFWPKDMDRIKAKSEMKECFRRGGAKTMRYLLVNGPEDIGKALDFASEVGFPVSIPASYLPQENLRVTLYRRMLKAESDGEVRALREETADRFGKLPPEVEFLFDAAAVRNAAYRYGITKVLAGRYELRVFCTPDENWEKLALPQRWRKRADGLIGPGGFAGMREMAQMLCRRDAAAQ